eukprot:TRINITY_DN112988_c0_g1_i1.p1 TRINITY_DN112988_c0_g1~~TRINITY_DN112988_c0_g1_i1.p1  ORF type:complete len:361 (+),score=34.97 TRINITY_DN112988_c0_g1_i1:94-1176(+)
MANDDGSFTFTVIDDGDRKAQPWHFILRKGSDKAVKIGRADYCDVRLDQRSVTSLHAEIRLKPGGRRDGPYLVVKDLGSTNGTAMQTPNDTKAPHALQAKAEEKLLNGASLILPYRLKASATRAEPRHWLRVHYGSALCLETPPPLMPPRADGRNSSAGMPRSIVSRRMIEEKRRRDGRNALDEFLSDDDEASPRPLATASRSGGAEWKNGERGAPKPKSRSKPAPVSEVADRGPSPSPSVPREKQVSLSPDDSPCRKSKTREHSSDRSPDPKRRGQDRSPEPQGRRSPLQRRRRRSPAKQSEVRTYRSRSRSPIVLRRGRGEMNYNRGKRGSYSSYNGGRYDRDGGSRARSRERSYRRS